MRRSLILFYAIGVFCVALCLSSCAGNRSAAGSSEQKHFFWKVSDENSSVWVLGSIHLADSTLYPLAPVIDSAFAHAEELAVELNMNDEEVVKEIGKESVSQGMLDERLLRDILPPEMWNTLDSLCAAWDIPMVVFEKMRPWLVATTLSAYAFEQAGLNPEYGIDYVLLDRAAANGKAIVGLETAEEQIGALADTTESDSAGVYYLKTTLREIAELETLVKNLIHAWKTGDEDLLRSLLDKDDEEDESEDSLSSDQKFKEGFEQRVYLNRNAKMAESIASFLRENRNVFVVVGVAHLALEKDNVIDALRKRGFRIEMDDFGSGYSSLNMLTALPIDALKLDMKFIRGICENEKNERLVGIMIDIARLLEVPVIAEGVETKEQMELLKKLGCDIIQGYYFSKPLPPEEFGILIEKELKETNYAHN